MNCDNRPVIRETIHQLPASRIREVANAGLARSDVLKFWFGEGDQVTPAFIREAAKAALDAGETFYNHNLGIIELRETLAEYSTRLHRPVAPITSDRIAVTSAGVHALSLVDQALIDPGDRVVIVTPVWPNLTSMPRIMSANVVRVALECRNGAWSLDLQKLLDAATPDTRLVLVNSPNNPTGWTMPQRDWDALLAHCRRHGIWLVSDDAYERLVFDAALTIDGHAPGVLAAIDDDDRVISANTFSKSWTMTGWRLGWLVAPKGFIAQIGKVIEFNTSCAPTFVQQAGIVAVRDGESLVHRPWRACVPRATCWSKPLPRCRAPRSRRHRERCTCSSALPVAATTASLSRSGSWPNPGSASHRAWPSVRKAKDSCAGALQPPMRCCCRGWSGWRASSSAPSGSRVPAHPCAARHAAGRRRRNRRSRRAVPAFHRRRRR